MKKGLKIFFFILSGIIILWIAASLTNTFRSYSNPTVSNEPTLEEGGRFFISNLKDPERFSFICFTAKNEQSGQSESRVSRVVGIPGDKISLINGDLYVNDKPQDHTFNLLKQYIVSQEEFIKIGKDLPRNRAFKGDNDSMIVLLPTKTFNDQKVNGRRLVYDSTMVDKQILNRFKNNWNQDNFGPVSVPANTYFVLGDNRLQAQDSRYIGFIPFEQVIGTVLGKK